MSCSGCGTTCKTLNGFKSNGQPTSFDNPKVCSVLCTECVELECCKSCGWFTGDGLCRVCRQMM